MQTVFFVENSGCFVANDALNFDLRTVLLDEAHKIYRSTMMRFAKLFFMFGTSRVHLCNYVLRDFSIFFILHPPLKSTGNIKNDCRPVEGKSLLEERDVESRGKQRHKSWDKVFVV
jgi:hypothetical protein